MSNEQKTRRKTSVQKAGDPEAFEVTPFGRRPARGKFATAGMWVVATLRLPFTLIYRCVTARNHGV